MAEALRVVTYNIRHGLGADGRVSIPRIAGVVERHHPDVLALQEVDVATRRSGGVDQPAELGRALEMQAVFGRTMERDGGAYGNALLSRRPVRVLRDARLPPGPIEKVVEPRGALVVSIDSDDGPIRIIDTHLGLGRFERGAQMEALLDWIGPRTLVCGDLNCTALSGPMRSATARVRDAQRAVHGWRTRPTWPARLPLLRIDHVLVSPDLEVTSAVVPWHRLARTASDHLPVVVTVRGRR